MMATLTSESRNGQIENRVNQKAVGQTWSRDSKTLKQNESTSSNRVKPDGRKSWLGNALRAAESRTVDNRMPSLDMSICGPWRTDTVEKLKHRDHVVRAFVDIVKKNPDLPRDPEEDKYAFALDTLRKQFVEYRDRNKKRFRLIIAALVIFVIAFVATAIALSVVLSSNNGVCSGTYRVTDVAQLRSLLKDCRQINDLTVESFVGEGVFGGLERVGNLTITNCVEVSGVFTNLTFPNLIDAQNIRVYSNPGLVDVGFPVMTQTVSGIYIDNNPMWGNITLPSATSLGRFYVTRNMNIERVDFPQLKTLEGVMEFLDVVLGNVTAPLLEKARSIVLLHVKPFSQNLERAISVEIDNQTLTLDAFGAMTDAILVDLPSLRETEGLSFSRVLLMHPLRMPSLQIASRVEMNIVNFRCLSSPCTDQIYLPNLRSSGRIDFQYCSEIHNLTLPSMVTVQEVSLLANSNLTSFTMAFPPALRNASVPVTVGWVRIMLNSKLTYVDLGDVEISEEGIQIFNDDELKTVLLPKLRQTTALVVSSTSRLSNLSLPAFEQGTLVLANNDNLKLVSAPKYQNGSAFILLKNLLLNTVEVPNLQVLNGSAGLAEIYWLLSAAGPAGSWGGMLLVEGNPSLLNITLPSLRYATGTIFTKVPRRFMPYVPALAEVYAFALIGDENDKSTVTGTDTTLSLPVLSICNSYLLYNMLIMQINMPILSNNTRMWIAHNPEITTISAPNISWPSTRPNCQLCIEGNQKLCTPSNMPANFAPNTTAEDTRACNINSEYMSTGPVSLNVTAPAPNCTNQAGDKPPCCDVSVVQGTFCSNTQLGICQVALAFMHTTSTKGWA
eukprot:comp15566_c0_seq1/m.12636 comp15566_c0_seq1/g.12636  ORF comp15566_c0_seq1/g.12636 comp15566_c0_seq1/m.12636 type:complete len:840 (-) comp15566_c0_seq1:578-3097(-)